MSSATPLFVLAPNTGTPPHHAEAMVLSARVSPELRQRVHDSAARAGEPDASHALRRLLQAALDLERATPTADGPGQARRSDTATARAAAVAKAPKRGTQRGKVLEALLAEDLSPWELVDRTGIPYGSVTPRIGELEAGGWVEATVYVGTSTPVTRTTPYGAEARVLTATAKARAWQELNA